MEYWDPEKEEEVKAERRRKLEKDYRGTIISYLSLYGYEETKEPDTFFSFENKEKGIKVIVLKYRGRQSWRYQIDFYVDGEKVHSEDVGKIDVGNTIIDTESMLIQENIRQKGQQLLDQQNL